MKEVEKKIEDAKEVIAQPAKVVTFERNGMTVKCEGVLCTIVKQEKKGPNKEVVNFKKVVGEEWQWFKNLKDIPEGTSTIALKPHVAKTLNKNEKKVKTLYIIEKVPTKEQQEKLEKLKKQIEEIESQIEEVKIANTDLTIDEIKKLCEVEKVDLITFLKEFVEASK